MRNKTIPAGKIGLGASLALLSGGAAQAAKPARQNPKRPNIVLVIADDCRHYDLGCYGSPDAITPNIDRLAAQGLRFERFFQATAMSSPTRHCLLTGLYPVRSGAYPNHTRLDEGVQTLPEYLKEAGYRVALQGKRHIAPIKAFPFEFLSEESLRSVHPEKIEPFLADVAQTGEPFFLYVGSTEPHDPWTLGDRILRTVNDRTLVGARKKVNLFFVEQGIKIVEQVGRRIAVFRHEDVRTARSGDQGSGINRESPADHIAQKNGPPRRIVRTTHRAERLRSGDQLQDIRFISGTHIPPS